MTPRERIINAINHRQSDKVPVDFGGTTCSGMHASVVYKLRKAFNLPERPVKLVNCMQMLGEIEEDLQDKLLTDCAMYMPYASPFGYRYEKWKPWTLFDGTPVLVPEGFNTAAGPDGGIYQYPQGDKTVPPSGLMPKGGFYFDAIIRQDPNFDSDNPSVEDNLEEFTIYNDEVLNYHRKAAESLRKSSDRAIIANLGFSSLGNIAAVPGLFMKHPKGIRDIEEWYMSLASRKDFLKELFDRQSQIGIKNYSLFKDAVGSNIDIVYLCGSDLGAQNGPLCSVSTIEEVFMPYYKRMCDWIHGNTNWKIMKHCCGSIKPLIPLFIEAGIDILNPVQNSAADMDAQTLKDEFGSKITFWGGGVDTQRTLPFGSPDEVFKEVTERIRIYKSNGGFVFNTIHNIQAGVPVENLLAMIEGVRQFR